MKLILCEACNDVVGLDYKHRTCRCGRSSGRYIKSGLEAIYSGPCRVIAMINHEVEAALAKPDGDVNKFYGWCVLNNNHPHILKTDAYPCDGCKSTCNRHIECGKFATLHDLAAV